MPFRNSNNSRTSNNFESSGSNNFYRNNFYNQKNFNENLKHYNACISFGSGQPQAPPQPRTCFKCETLGHLANACRYEPLNMAESSEPNERLKSVFMSSFNNSQVPQTRPPSFNNVICKNSNGFTTESDFASAVFAARERKLSNGILAIKGNLAGRHFDDIIVDTGSAVSLISTSLWTSYMKSLLLL